jgi:SAM-dependent methyltransferase
VSAPTRPAQEPAGTDAAARTPSGTGYDDIAEGYARWWGPVIQPGAIRVLDPLAAAVEGGPRDRGDLHLLDVGSGTGALAIAALERWPSLRVTGIDPSGGMLEVARRNADANLSRVAASRYDTLVAYADELPFEAQTFELAASSFVLQLVPNRAAALREVRRVLRPGGTFAWVTWLRSERPFAPDRVVNEVLDDYGFDPPEPDQRSGDVASAAAAALGMRRAGFRDVTAWADEVAHPWDARGYLDFYTQFDEASLFADLEPDERSEIEQAMLDRLSGLSPEDLTLRLPTVYAVGRAAG